jgi:hypothetical protein
MKVSILRWIGLGLLMAAGLGSTAPAARADDTEDNDKFSVTVAFGSGLNTLPPSGPSGPPNHHILPPEIVVRQNGVVHFMISGFHQVVVYNPETKPGDIMVPPPGTTFINDKTNVFYFGIPPQGGPPPPTPPTTNPFNGSNRQESVSFANPGIYLVICNVRAHFLDGMFAFVKVVPPDEDLPDDHSHH